VARESGLTRRDILATRCCEPPALPLSSEVAARNAQVFRALGDETRLQIVELLAKQSEPLCVCDLEASFKLSQPTISHHLKVLRDADLVVTERRGVWIYYQLQRDRLRILHDIARAVFPDGETEGETNKMTESSTMREAVRDRYAQIALRVLQPESPVTSGSCCAAPTDQNDAGSCCGSTSGCGNAADPITGNLYDAGELSNLPADAITASLGCGNPTALAALTAGEVVLDLGSGGGIDVLLSARRVGPTGKAYGLDMTDEMLDLARKNVANAGVANVEFLKGQIENIPLPDNTVDVIISNCVLNLSTDKSQVLREAFRVLKPGGRFAVSDVVVDGPVPADLRQQAELWIGCIAGALDRADYLAKLGEAGFTDISIEPTRFYQAEDVGDPGLTRWLDAQPSEERSRLNHAFMSAFVRARKPGTRE
jgi:arsenite methyltransferase